MKRVFDDLHIFCCVVETGSLKQAAQRLSMPHSTVSRRIDALEQNLSLTLLHRTTREVRVTERGQELYQDCAQLLTSVQRSIDVAIDSELRLKGKLKVSMPVRAGVDFLGAWLIDFATEHPELSLDLSLSNQNKNLLQEDIDLAFRVGPLVDSSAIALKLWDIPYTLCAHPSFIEQHKIHNASVTPKQLINLPSVVTRPALSWAFIDEQNQQVQLEPNAQMIVDDLGLAVHAATTAKVAAMLPSSMLAESDLLPINVVGLEPRTRVMYAYYIGRRHAQSHIKKVVEYIKLRYLESNL